MPFLKVQNPLNWIPDDMISSLKGAFLPGISIISNCHSFGLKKEQKLGFLIKGTPKMTQKTGPKNDLFWAKKLHPFCLGYVAVELRS